MTGRARASRAMRAAAGVRRAPTSQVRRSADTDAAYASPGRTIGRGGTCGRRAAAAGVPAVRTTAAVARRASGRTAATLPVVLAVPDERRLAADGAQERRGR